MKEVLLPCRSNASGLFIGIMIIFVIFDNLYNHCTAKFLLFQVHILWSLGDAVRMLDEIATSLVSFLFQKF